MRRALTTLRWAMAAVTLLSNLAAQSANAQTALVSVPTTAIESSESPSRIQAEVAAESSRLSNDSPDWRALSLRVARTRGPRQVQELTLTDSSRFGLKDQQIGALIALPLAERLTATLDAQVSPSHRVLARHGVGGNLQYEFAPAWLLHTGVGFKRFNDARVTQGSVMIEHYFSSFSAAAAWKPVSALGTHSTSTEVRAAWYYGDASSLALVLSRGDEATAVAASRVELADVRSLAVFGSHRFSPAWSLTYGLARTRQGAFYNLNSVRLGAQYLF
jgi:YaiO family outer membrane protein